MNATDHSVALQKAACIKKGSKVPDDEPQRNRSVIFTANTVLRCN